jgi:hypothetical protein
VFQANVFAEVGQVAGDWRGARRDPGRARGAEDDKACEDFPQLTSYILGMIGYPDFRIQRSTLILRLEKGENGLGDARIVVRIFNL